jgi:hypothetical protein
MLLPSLIAHSMQAVTTLSCSVPQYHFLAIYGDHFVQKTVFPLHPYTSAQSIPPHLDFTAGHHALLCPPYNAKDDDHDFSSLFAFEFVEIAFSFSHDVLEFDQLSCS